MGTRVLSLAGRGGVTWEHRHHVRSGGTHHKTLPSKRPWLWSASSAIRCPRTRTAATVAHSTGSGARPGRWGWGIAALTGHVHGRACDLWAQTGHQCGAGLSHGAPQGFLALSGGCCLWGSHSQILQRNACAVTRSCGVSCVLRVRGRGRGAAGHPNTTTHSPRRGDPATGQASPPVSRAIRGP